LTFQFEIEVENFENLRDHFLILLSLLVFENFNFTFENLGAHFSILERRGLGDLFSILERRGLGDLF